MGNYDHKDITELRNYLVSIIDSFMEHYSTRNWSDRNESDIGMVFLELAAGVTDMLNYYLDKQALENYLPTATIRRNLKRIVSLVDYQLMGPIPSSTVGLFTLEHHFDFDFTLPKYFQVSYSRGNRGNIYYATENEVTIPAGTRLFRVNLLQGITKTINMTVGDLLRSRKIRLKDNNVAQGSVTVYIDGEEWTQVSDVLIEDVFGKKYSVYEDIDDCPVIEFGYSYTEYLPTEETESVPRNKVNAPVTIKYLCTEGSHGNVAAGKIDTVESSLIIDDEDISKVMSVTNLLDSTGGQDREDMEVARIMAPHVWHSERRMTTTEDYKKFLERFDKVLKAQIVTWESDYGHYVFVPYKVNAYVLSNEEDIYIPDREYLSKLKEAIEPYLWCSIDIDVLPPKIRDIDITVRIDTGTDRFYNYTGLRDELDFLYNEFFEKERRSFGEKFTLGQFESIARQSTLVDKVEIVEPTELIELGLDEFPRLGKLTVEIRNGLEDEQQEND